MNNETTMTSFTSPRTGLTYQCVLRTDSYTRYDITLDGKWVQFSLTEKGIADSIARHEGITDGWTTSPRD